MPVNITYLQAKIARYQKLIDEELDRQAVMRKIFNEWFKTAGKRLSGMESAYKESGLANHMSHHEFSDMFKEKYKAKMVRVNGVSVRVYVLK